MQKPWSCDDSMGGNTIVREVEPGRGEGSDQQRSDRSVEQPVGSGEGDRRPRV